MRFFRHGTILLSVAMAGLATTAVAAAPPAAGQAVTRVAGPCIKVTATVPLAKASGGIAVNPKTNTVYATNGGHQVIVISGRTNTVTATIPVAQFPESIVVDPKTNTIYVTGMAPDEVTVTWLCHRPVGWSGTGPASLCAANETLKPPRALSDDEVAPGPAEWVRSRIDRVLDHRCRQGGGAGHTLSDSAPNLASATFRARIRTNYEALRNSQSTAEAASAAMKSAGHSSEAP